MTIPGDPFDPRSFELLADCLPHMVWTCTADGQCNYSNRRWRDYVGAAAPQTDAVNWRDWIHPEDLPRLQQVWNSADGSQPMRIELRLCRHDRMYHWFDTQAVPLRDIAGRLVKWIITGTDIQETVDIRVALQASEQRWRLMFDAAPVSLWVQDTNTVINELQALPARGIDDAAAYIRSHPEFVVRMINSIKVLDVNNRTLSLFRAQRKEQLLGYSLGRIYATPAAIAAFTEFLITLARGQLPAPCEMEHVAVDGTVLRLQWQGEMWTPDGSLNLALISRVDVSELSQAMEQLRHKSTMLEHMSNLAKVGGWVMEVGGASQCTDEVARIHGFEPRESLTAEQVLGSMDEAERTYVQALMQRAIEHAEPYAVELKIPAANHGVKWIRSQVLPIVQDGRVIRLEGATQDITDRKLAELAVQSLNEELERQVAERTQQLGQTRHDLQNILDAIPCMVGYWDKDLRLRFTNQTYQKGVGKSAAELQGILYTELLPDQYLQDRLPLAHLALQGHPQRFESWVQRLADERLVWAITYYQPDMVAGEVRGFYVLTVDATDQKLAEDGLRAANRELEAFAYAVAHDLRAPLRAMSGFSHALLEDHSDTMAAEARSFAQEIDKASHRMGELLNGLLTLSRSTQGELRRDRVDLSSLAVSQLMELQRMEPERRVQWQVAPDLIAFADARMLDAVMRNLLDNAWKYTAHAAQARITVDADYFGGVWHYNISDNGAGFDMAHVERLFKPFQRLHRQDEFPGLGIGLATVRRIVSRHGGELTVHAVPGKGARFRFSLGESLKGHDA